MPTSSQPFESAKWIWPESQSWDIHNSYALFRKDFTLPSVPQTAPLFITADQSYQLYINGHYVGRGPARGFQDCWPYDEVDIAPLLHAGSNLLAVRAYHPGFSTFQYLTQGFAGLLVAARWDEVSLNSDETWKGRRQEGTNPATMPVSLQLFSQEHIDLRLEDPAWMTPEYDDSTWKSPMATSVWNAMPWSSLETRGIPALEETMDPAVARAIGTAAGQCAPDFRNVRDAARLRFAEGLAHGPEQFSADEIRFEPTGESGFRSYLLDFGRPVVGSIGLEIEGALGGEIIDTLHVETIDEATLTPDYLPDTHCRLAFAHRLTCRAGRQSHFFYHPFGFRFMVLTVRGATQELRLRPKLRTSLYPLEKHGLFDCSDPVLQQIWEVCAWTQRICCLDAYVDTPWREQAQWWGDARVQAKNTFFYSGDPRLFRRGIKQIAHQRTPEGLTYGHAPTMAHSCILPDFSLIWLLTLWDYFWQTESTEPFETHHDAVVDVLGYFRAMTDPAMGLVRYDPRYWLFLDWTDIHRTGLPSVLNLWLLIALKKMEFLYRRVGREKKAAKLRAWRKDLQRALAQAVGKDGLMRDGYDESGKLVEESSIHAQVLALMAGLPGIDQARVLDEVVLPYVQGEREFRASPSAYWITYIFDYLRERGHASEVVDGIRRRWTPMVAQGSTWENFAPVRGQESFSHAWSAHPLFHLMEILGGIVQTAPGWRQIRFEPNFLTDSCVTSIPTPRGSVRSEWQREGNRVHVQLALPRGVEAEVKLPGMPQGIIEGSARWTITCPAR